MGYLPEKRLEAILQHDKPLLSLSMPSFDEDRHEEGIGGSGGSKNTRCLEDELPNNGLAPDKEAALSVLRAAIEEALRALTSREAEIIRLRFGLNEDGIPRTLRAIAKKFSISHQRVEQIEKRALRRLGHPARAKPLEEFLGK